MLSRAVASLGSRSVALAKCWNATASSPFLSATRPAVRSATDVTGFGLLGHGLEMARASGTRFVFDASSLPALPGALALAASGVETDGAAHNRRFVAEALEIGPGVAPEWVSLAHDPQTSGGLLAAIPPHQLSAVETALADGGVIAIRIGVVEPSDRPGVSLT